MKINNKLTISANYRFAITTMLCLFFGFTFLDAQTYCASKGNLPWSEWIAGVKFGTINNASSKEGYGNFTSITTTLTRGTSYPLSITQGFSYAPDAANATQQGKVWIDYNQNKTFEATELVASFTRTTTTANVVIPTTALLGATRMRVSLKTIGAPTACEIFDKGEVEDYTVNITGGTVGNPNCLNKFVLSTYSSATCSYSGTPSSKLSTLDQYGQNIADGFMLQVNFPNNSVMTFFTRSNTTTAPLDRTYPNCSSNWLYFNAYGTIVFNTPISGVQNNEFNNFIIRVRTVGSASNPDSIYVDINDNTSLVSISKKKDCNACYANDVTVPVITNCPTTIPDIPLATSPTVGYKFSTLNALLNISSTDNCPNDNPSLRFVVPENSRVTATWGATQSYSVVAFDSAGNKSGCRFTVRFTTPTSNLPDLTLANLTVQTPTVQQGQAVNFKVDLKNIGTAAAAGNFTIKSYLSTDQTLSTNDYANGVVQTGGYSAGFFVPQEPLSMTVSSILAAGPYYLILKIDADNSITESNEANNILISTTPITVTKPRTSTCVNTFEFKQLASTDCIITNSSSTASTASLSQYGQNIADGFIVRATVFNNYSMLLFARNGTTTQPAGTTFTACPGNWVYFSTYGTIDYRIPRNTDREVTNFVIRAKAIGNATNPDSIYLEFQGPVKYVSISKKVNCNACYSTDVTAPVFTNCPTTIPTIQLSTSPSQPLVYNILNINLTDDCPNSNLVLRADTPPDGSVFATWGGTQSYKSIAFDSAGHRSVCAFTVRFSDPPCGTVTTPPTIANCPANIIVQTNIGETCAAATWTPPTATSPYPIGISLTSNYASGFCFPIGTTPVTYTAAYGSCTNTSKCTFNVTVIRGVTTCTSDVTPPVITNCPANQVLPAPTNSTSICTVFSWAPPTATDLCSTPTLSFVTKRGSRIPFQSSTLVSAEVCSPENIDTIVYTARDAAGNTATCQFQLKMTLPTTGGGSDIALSMTTTPSVYKPYTAQNFRITAKNSGTTAFSDIKIKFTRPALTSTGGTKTASIGTFRDYCPGGIECSEWTIPSLAGGATATLDAPVFILAPTGGITATATLLSSTPTDNVVANNTASITVNPATAPLVAPAQALAFKVPTQLIPVIIQAISPNPTEGDVQIKLDSWTKQTVDFNFSDITGKTIYSEKRDVEKGLNRLDFEVFHLPQGVYFIQTNVGKGKDVPTKFVKM
jgi:hypothetical protein